MSHLLYKIGNFSGRHPWRVISAWLVIAGAVFMLNGSIGGASDESFSLPGAESQRASDAIQDRFPQETLYSSNVVFHSEEGLTAPETKQAVEQAVTKLEAGPHVIAVSSPYDPRGPTVSEDGQTAFATVGFDKEKVDKTDFDAAEKAVQDLRDAGIQVEYDGGLGYANAAAGGNSELIGILMAVLILAIAFGSLVAMSLPIVTALFAIVIGSSAIGIMSGLVPVPSITGVVAMMLGLGVGIDYALFILARHRQNLASGQSVPVAIGRANATAGLSVLFAGVTVIVAILGLKVSGIPMMSMMGYGSAIMVAVTMLASITLLPAMLGVVKHKVNSARIPFVKSKPAYNPDARSARWAQRVVNKPFRYGGAAAVVLGILAIPVFSMHLGFADAGNDAPDSTTRHAYDLMADGYGPGTNGPLEVVLESDRGTPLPQDAIDKVGTALAHEPGVASVGQPTTNKAADIAIFTVTPTTSPQDAKTGELLADVRQDVLPEALAGTDVEASVTGATALTDDVSSRLQERMPLFLGAVIGLSFLVLMVVFRSVLVPLKAAALNVLGVGAAYGVIVAVFQWGWGASLIGVHETVPIMPLAPMLMFAILFGLSMDYEVFLMSRVREQYLKHRNPGRAVVEGVGSTAKIITSAAIIMISVFASFILDVDVTTKMFGVGLSVAVFLDVTLVRMVLVPAAMSLLGHRAWWLPAWLERRLPVIDIEGGSHDGEEPLEPESQPESQPESESDRTPVLV
ncbi:MAG TPA: MMPL family transporter [Nocardioides sp.]|jgi:RND superfamily putative drug exporter|nr:MMPL family transporter [Nocardioides sp.]